MNFIDLLYEDEGISITPFTLYSIAKRKLFKKVKNLEPALDIPEKIARNVAMKGEMIKEKIKAEFGRDSGDGEEGTLYSLTPEQIDVMEDILDKYGYKLYREIKAFRREVLAPYEVLKRKIKKNSRVNVKEVYGLTKEEFLAAYESGRRKIENRGYKYASDSTDIRARLDKYDEQLKEIKELKKKFEETGEYNGELLEKLFNKIGLGAKEFGGKIEGEKIKAYSLSKIQKAFKDYEKAIKEYDEWTSQENIDKINREIEDIGFSTKYSRADKLEKMAAKKNKYEKTLEARLKNIAKSLTTEGDKELYKDKGYLASLFKYLTRKSIMDKFKNKAKEDHALDYYYYFYLELIDSWSEKIKSYKSDRVQELKDLDKNLEFTEDESKIFKPKSRDVKYSSDINDYKQMIKIEDFPDDSYIPVRKSPELIKAMERIEREIKKFENKLKSILSDEDLARLKKYRLINNLIKIRELKDPDKLFKSEEEIERTFKTTPKKESEMEYNIESKSKDSLYVRRVEEELEKAKRYKKVKDEIKLRAQKVKMTSIIKEFRRVDIKADKKLKKFEDDFDSIGFNILKG